MQSTIRALPGDAAAQGFLSPARWERPPHPPVGEAGYRVDELSVAGTARLYRDGARRPPAVAGEADYVTRALAVRPADDAAFSGVVHVELLNPSVGFDFPMFWPDAGRHLMRRGDAYIGVTCKAVTADALRHTSPARYGGLSIPHDGVIWDLIGAVATACRGDEAGGLLPGLRRPDRVLLNGWSQSGSFLRTYLSDGLHELHSRERGGEICDGYLIGVSSGGFGPMGYVNVDRDGEMRFDADLRPSGEYAALAIDDPRRVVRGASVPVVELMSEDEARQNAWHQRPDSDQAGDLFRCYQLPGRGHESGLLTDAMWVADREAVGYAGDPDGSGPPRHRATTYVLAAILDGLVAWADGTPPPRADPLVVRVDPAFPRDPEGIDFRGVVPVVDDAGHAVGGVRYLDVELPIARMAAVPDGPMTVRAWRHEAFDAAELRRRYGSPRQLRDRARRVAADLVAAGWLNAVDAPAAIDGLCRACPPDWRT